mmetsp:Transcript_17042/g.47550  ORF Transcript_17042/g.47550 Transcript_17042/m.47550 type:complete len:99 (+) Transcript_17042:750-1046(+)
MALASDNHDLPYLQLALAPWLLRWKFEGMTAGASVGFAALCAVLPGPKRLTCFSSIMSTTTIIGLIVVDRCHDLASVPHQVASRTRRAETTAGSGSRG